MNKIKYTLLSYEPNEDQLDEEKFPLEKALAHQWDESTKAPALNYIDINTYEYVVGYDCDCLLAFNEIEEKYMRLYCEDKCDMIRMCAEHGVASNIVQDILDDMWDFYLCEMVD